MAVQRVTLTAADDNYSPPLKEIDITVIEVGGGEHEVFITVYKGSDEDLLEGRAKEYDVPVLNLSDLIQALSAFAQTSDTTFTVV